MTVTIRIAPESRDKDFVEDIMNQVTLLEGDCLQELKKLPGESVHCCVTAPPCWMGPDEGVNHRYIGMEQAPEQFILKLLHIFRELQRVLCERGMFWLIMGDCSFAPDGRRGIPWHLAFALESDGWHLRKEHIWDDMEGGHDYIFLFTKDKLIPFTSYSSLGSVWHIPLEASP